MANSLTTPLPYNVPIVDEKGNPTPFFQRLMQQLLKEKATTDTLAEAAVPGSRQVIAGTGLTGGGPLSADVTLNSDPEYIRDTVAAFVAAGSNVTVTHDDVANTLTIDASGGGGGGSSPQVVKISSYYYPTDTMNFGSSSATFASPDVLFLYPFSVPINVGSLTVNVSSTSTATEMKTAIYTTRGGSGTDANFPGLRVALGTPVAVNVSGNRDSVITPTYAVSGLVWLAFMTNGNVGLRAGSLKDSAVLGSDTLVSGTRLGLTFSGSTYAAGPPADLTSSSFTPTASGFMIAAKQV